MKEEFYLTKKKDEITIRSSAAEYLTYVASVGDQADSIEMRYEDENIWLTQKMMATLYDVDVRTINYHIKKIFSDSELQENSVIQKFRITAADGKAYNTNHYSLEMIIAVGFKVNSERAVQFRKWVNQIAKDYTIKGWVMDDERLKRGTYLTEKYFDEQLERIREIRASERKFYQKITDLYATAIDYDKNSATTRRFYATVQNKMHYAVHGHTAAELIVERADHTREHMGLTTWADAPEGKIKKSDVTVAKNYLSQDEMKQLNRMVTAYLDFAENMTLRHIPLTMQDWEKRLNSFIEMFDFPFPTSLVDENGFFRGQIILTLVNKSLVDEKQAGEYCQSNIDVFFGTYETEKERDVTKPTIKNPRGVDDNQNLLSDSLYSASAKGIHPINGFERECTLVKYGKKFHPVKKYAIDLADMTPSNRDKWLPSTRKWYLKIEGLYRDFIEKEAVKKDFQLSQEYCMILTIRDPEHTAPVYDEVTQQLTNRNFIHHDVRVRNVVHVTNE